MSMRAPVPAAQTGFRAYTENRKHVNKVKMVILTIILILGSISFLLPFWWMIQTSLKTLKEIMTYPPTWFPSEIVWWNYAEAWEKGNFALYTLNTSIIAFTAVVAHIIANSFIAYGFAKIKFPFKTFLFSFILGSMIIPHFVTLIPTYMLFAKLHWVGTYLPLVVPGFFGTALHIFLVRQFYLSIPNDLIEAAKIDGANHFYIWAKIMIPLSKPALATIAIWTFTGAWNDFLGPLIYINEEAKYTLQLGLQVFKVSSGVNQWHLLMAGSVLVLLPVLIIFFLFQRYFIEGMNISAGTKG